jgi:hypothetical protein
MAYYKWALDEIHGFDPVYRKAGDDVDVCWRIMQNGHKIGFSPAAIVWHYRRFTVDAYFGQQKGYGEAEAMLRRKHQNYFGSSGSAIWHGRVYTQVRIEPFFAKPIVYHGIFGTGFFQSVYPRAENPYLYLFGSLEWVSFAAMVLVLSVPWPWLRLVPLILFALTLAAGLSYMMRARIEPRFDSIRARLLLFYLAVMQPLQRGWARNFTWLRGKRTTDAVVDSKEREPHVPTSFLRAGHLTFWSEAGKERNELLREIEVLLDGEGWNYTLDTGWTDWDVHIFASRWWSVRLRTMTEIYPQGRRLTRAGNFLVASTFSNVLGVWAIFLAVAVVIGVPKSLAAPVVASVCGLLAIGVGIWLLGGLRLRHRVAELVQVAAVHAGLQTVKPRK